MLHWALQPISSSLHRATIQCCNTYTHKDNKNKIKNRENFCGSEINSVMQEKMCEKQILLSLNLLQILHLTAKVGVNVL